MIKMTTKLLSEKIPYRKTVWVTGFLKTTLSSSLIATGIVLFSHGITGHPFFNMWDEISIIVGACMILLAIMIVIIIDKWKDQKKKEELETINQHIDERAIEIAEEKILEAMGNIK